MTPTKRTVTLVEANSLLLTRNLPTNLITETLSKPKMSSLHNCKGRCKNSTWMGYRLHPKRETAAQVDCVLPIAVHKTDKVFVTTEHKPYPVEGREEKHQSIFRRLIFSSCILLHFFLEAIPKLKSKFTSKRRRILQLKYKSKISHQTKGWL